MKVSGPHVYAIRFDSSGIRQKYALSESRTKRWKPIPTFRSPLTSKTPKLYVFSDGKWPYYVGITRQSLSTRLNYGFKASVEKRLSGYGGYAFKNHEKAAVLHVWVEEEAPSRDPKNMGTVEAELVHRIRLKGAWPKYQTEIHFFPFEDIHTGIADSIFKVFTSLKSRPLPLPV